MTSDYKQFLSQELPKLKNCKIPFFKRTRKSKHDTMRYILNKNILDTTGIFAEFGVYKGTTIKMIAKAYPNTTVYGFDSFEGFPEDGRKDWKNDFSLQGKLPEVPENVRLLKGYFEETLEKFAKENEGNHLSFMHIDCDIYSSTKTIFNTLDELIKPGCIIVFDELLHYDGFENNEIKAFYEYLQDKKRKFEWLAIRNKVIDLKSYLDLKANGFTGYETMKDWREKGYEQEVALRIL